MRAFCSLLIKIIKNQNQFRVTIRVSNSLNPYRMDRHSVVPVDSFFLQGLSSADKK